jgi:hypothetical protein
MVHGPFSRKDASPSHGNGFTRHGARPLFAGGRVLLARERVPRRGGRPLLAEGRVPLARERVHQAWWTAPSRRRTRPPPSGRRSPGMVHGRSSLEDASSSLGNVFTRRGGRPLLAGGRVPLARETRSPRMVRRPSSLWDAPLSLGKTLTSSGRAVTRGGKRARFAWALRRLAPRREHRTVQSSHGPHGASDESAYCPSR